MNELLQLPSNLSTQYKVNFLESSIYNKASDLLRNVLGVNIVVSIFQ